MGLIDRVDQKLGCESSGWGRARALSIAVYLVVALVLAWLTRYQINPDLIAYIQAARHYADGSLDLAVSSWWGPLLTWLLVPFIWMKFEPIPATKLIGIVFGLGFASGVSALVRGMTGGRGWFVGFVLGLLAALIMLSKPITPDLLLACLIMWYLVQSMKLLKRDSPGLALGIGVLGGVAYLAKAYALPFVVAHLGITTLVKMTLVKRRSISICLKQYTAGFAGLLIVALPWVVVISLQDGQFTISSAGKYASVWYPMPNNKPLPVHLLQLPRDGRIMSFENPMEIREPWPIWSPFDGVKEFKHKIRIIVSDIRLASNSLNDADVLGLMKVGFIFAIVFLFPLRETLKTHRGVLRLWACLSTSLFIGGYLLVGVLDGRYLWPAWGMILALCVVGPGMPWSNTPNSERSESDDKPSLMGPTLATWHRLMLAFLVASIVFNAAVILEAWSRRGGGADRTVAVKDAGDQFKPHQLFAANKWHLGLHVTYWANGTFLGEITGTTPEEVAKELTPFGQVIVLVGDDPKLARALADSSLFTKLEINSGIVSVFELLGSAPATVP